MIFGLYFFLLTIITCFSAIYGLFRYQTPLNPLTVFCIIQIGLFTMVSGFVAVSITSHVLYDSTDIIFTITVSIVYLLGFLIPFLFNGNILVELYGKALKFFKLDLKHIANNINYSKFVFLFFASIGAFASLAILGKGGLLWLTDTRTAYINYRAGAGPFFALTQWLITFTMLYYLWTRKPKIFKLIIVVILFCCLIFFLGSKNNILTIIVIAIVYYNYFVKRIPLYFLVFGGFLMFFLFLVLLIIQGSFSSIGESLFYFRDYFDTTTQFLSRFDEYGYQYGLGWLSSLWFYVPRGLYAEKPFEYGITLIHKVLFPGSAALGHTPGILPWSLYYLDFGVIGVFLGGLVIGVFQKTAYEYFLRNRNNIFAFILALHFTIWPVWTFAPFIFVLFISIGQSIFLRLKLKLPNENKMVL